MAEDQQSGQERTEQPTEKRKKDARKKGQVPRSRELNTMLSLLFAASTFVVLGRWMAVEFPQLIAASLTFDRALAFDKSLVAVRLIELIMSSLVVLTPLFALSILGALAGPMVMGGWAFSPAAAAFKLEKINPLTGLKRIFSAKGLMELLKALFKFLVLTAVTVVLFMFLLEDLLALGSRVPAQAFAESASILSWSLLVLSFAMIAIVAFDVPFELWNHNRQLKMTRREIQDELKETEGRPEVRSRIRALQRQLSQSRMMESAAEADVVITNPTHFSVALKYDGSPGQAPVVVAKGLDLIALKIRTVALENDVPLFEAPPLARALYASTEIGDEIPENLYLAVAKVLAYVYQLRTSRSDERTPLPDDLTIPDEYEDLFETGRHGDE